MAKKKNNKEKQTSHNDRLLHSSDALFSMSMAPRAGQSYHWFQMLPAVFSTAIIITIVRMATYQRPMSQFFWINSGNDLTDFFSYYKMIALDICAVLAIVILLYRVFSQSLAIKRTAIYIPMSVYSLFVIISYALSDYKEFALLGWNDRFEGTLTLLAYMVMLFYIINTINTETNVKWIIYPVAAVSVLLSLLGLTQALDCDFFRTTLGKKLITPTWFWDNLDTLSFTFQNREIYQTVYNINYVAFYLTLLIPLFGLLFIHSAMSGKDEPIWKKVLWGVLFGLTMFNMIGSKSSGGYLGLFVSVVLAIILLNKQILKWIKPLGILLIITALIGGVTYERWSSEISTAINGITNSAAVSEQGSETTDKTTSGASQKGHIDFIATTDYIIHIGYEGSELIIQTDPADPLGVILTDSEENVITTSPEIGPEGETIHNITDNRFANLSLYPAKDSAGISYVIVTIDEREWPFAITEDNGVLYRNDLGKLLPLQKIEAIGWENNPGFGSGRGLIWSRTLPMMKDTVIFGYGADTYCINYPHNDYVGKYNAGWDVNLIVDKPHNMYMGAWVGTGGISVLALLVMYAFYICQSFKLFWNRQIENFLDYSGLGIALGICGFLVTGLVDDSTVSVMPLFYGLLGTGIAINFILKKRAE